MAGCLPNRSEWIAGVAGDKTKDLLALQTEQKDLLAEQKTLQKDIKELSREANEKLKAIDASIKVEQDAITAAQDRATDAIEVVSMDTADTLEWIKAEYNILFAEKSQELKDKLAALGVTSVSLEDIGAASLSELQKIVAILRGQGIEVTPGAGPGEGMTG